MKLSKHLSIKEVTKSSTAARLGIDNTPTVSHLIALKEVAENIFEPLRLHFGVPIGVSSGYRSKRLTKLLVGVNVRSTVAARLLILTLICTVK
jgi:zinc D-Ala-D-Ala carboxypeptidase